MSKQTDDAYLRIKATDEEKSKVHACCGEARAKTKALAIDADADKITVTQFSEEVRRIEKEAVSTIESILGADRAATLLKEFDALRWTS
jgi:hypothetical protein